MMAQQPQPRTPVFVLGVHRSGTTWVANALCNHSRIYGVQAEEHFGIVESWYFSHLDRRFGELDEASRQVAFLELFRRTAFFRSGPVSAECLETLPRSSYALFFQAYLDQAAGQVKPGAQFWLEKTPVHTLYIQKLMTYYPGARFIAVERSLDGVLASALGLQAQRGRPPSSKALFAMVYHWYKYRAYLRHFIQRQPGSFFQLKYEELAGDPELYFRRCLDFLALDWEPGVLEERFKRNTSFARQPDSKRASLSESQKRQAGFAGALVGRLPFWAFRLQESLRKPHTRQPAPFLSKE
jgi:hypothetical protein